MTVTDITGLSPAPAVGWSAVETAGVWSFTAPPGPTLADAQTAQIARLNAACAAAIEAGFTASINGTNETVTLSVTDQTNALMAATTGQSALGANAWQASHAYSPNGIVMAGRECFVTFDGGTSGTAAPAWPTDFQVGVADGTVTWYKLGFWLGTANGNIMVDAASAVSLFGQGVVFISTQRAQYQALKAAVLSATTVAAVQAVVWP
ncbi:hypothetical protein [Acidocella sp.]|uniref:hypothetical protein n=1 Tax=Acidocella sp. TaxID=50710 RepID=UPI002617DFF1|nr:hypothetical protein [Acidocella sp.]